MECQSKIFDVCALGRDTVMRLPFSIRAFLENAMRNCDGGTGRSGAAFTEVDVEAILQWETTVNRGVEVPYQPPRVLMQDLSGVPALVDLAAMRNAMERLGFDPATLNPITQVDLVVDHSVAVRSG